MKKSLFLILLLLIVVFNNNINVQRHLISEFKFYYDNQNEQKGNKSPDDNFNFIINEIAHYISLQKAFKINNFDSSYIDEKKYPNKLKLIENDLIEQIHQFIIKNPFIRLEDSSSSMYYFVNYKKINFRFLWESYNHTNKFINAFVNYEISGQWIPLKINLLEYRYQYTDLDILNVVFNKYLLKTNGKIQFFDPNLQLDFWYNQVNENLKLFLKDQKFQINQEIFKNINYYDFSINSIRKTDFVEKRLVINISYKNSNKIFNLDIDYLWTDKKLINFINTKLSNWQIKISHNFNTWTNNENQIIINELLDFIGEKTIDENGFNINFDLKDKIKIINLNNTEEVENKKKIELGILYNDNKINMIKIIFVNEPNSYQKNKLLNIKSLIEKNIELDLKELNFLYLEKNLDNCLSIIVKELHNKVNQLILKQSDKELINHISENMNVDAYWLNLNDNKKLTLILEDSSFKNILKLKLGIYQNDKDNSKKIWNNIFQTNFNLLYNENKKYFIRTSYLKRYYYKNFQNIYDYNILLPYIENIWKTVLNYKDKLILYKNNQIIRATQFELIDYKMIRISTDMWDYTDQTTYIREHINFNIKDINGKIRDTYFNAVIINAKIHSLNSNKNDYSFILPIFVDRDILPIE